MVSYVHFYRLAEVSVTNDLYPITITNPSFGKFRGVTIYVTNDLYERLTQGGGSKSSVSLADLQSGRALRGLKHLIERIQEAVGDAKLVLTLGNTRRQGSNYFVNFDDYRKSGGSKFSELYRNVGLDLSLDFLLQHFPDEFEEQTRQRSENHLDVAAKDLARLAGRRRGEGEHIRRPGDRSAEGAIRTWERRLSSREFEAVEDIRGRSALLYHEEVVEALRNRLASDQGYPEVNGPDSWQEWIHRNSWLFGPMYLEPIDRQRVGLQEIPDFLFPTLDGFIDILEIKLPNKVVVNPGSKGSTAFSWSHDANRAIGQVVNYVQQMTINQYTLSKKLNRVYSECLGGLAMVLRPRAFILIGNESGWTEAHREGYRALNYSLHEIEVITYDELLRWGERLIDVYRCGAI